MPCADGSGARRHAPARRPRAPAASSRQSVKTAGAGGERGFDGTKKVTARKRNAAVDTLGLLQAGAVTATSADDAAAAPAGLARLGAARCPGLEVVRADSKDHSHALNRWVETAAPRRRIEVVRRPEGVKGFVLLPKRWVVERTFGWLMRSGRLGRDHERRTDSSEPMVHVSATHLTLRRLKPSDSYPPFR